MSSVNQRFDYDSFQIEGNFSGVILPITQIMIVRGDILKQFTFFETLKAMSVLNGLLIKMS